MERGARAAQLEAGQIRGEAEEDNDARNRELGQLAPFEAMEDEEVHRPDHQDVDGKEAA